MARITIEDCLPYVTNRFELVMLATKRARQLASGRVEPMVPPGHDKYTVVALREIAAGHINMGIVDAIDREQATGVIDTNTQRGNSAESSDEHG